MLKTYAITINKYNFDKKNKEHINLKKKILEVWNWIKKREKNNSSEPELMW